MFSALLFLQYHSFRNRAVTRLKRLKQPKYLIGAIAGGLYFYFYFFRYFLFRSAQHGPAAVGGPSEYAALYESLAALALFVIVLMAWVIPHGRAALVFSEAEVTFLFPAPISRQGLIHFKLARSQLRILFTILFLTLISRRVGGRAWIHAAGWWLILSNLNLHFLGSSFVRTLLLDRGIANWLRRVVVIGVVLGLACFVIVWARRTFPELPPESARSPSALGDYAQRVLTSGPALYLLYPFRLVARPFLAPDARAFLVALGPALLLFVLQYLWVIRSNVAFEEASVEASQRLATKVAAARAGNWQTARQMKKGKRPWFKLTPVGSPATALVWKNLISVGSALTWRIWISLSIMCIAFYAGFAGNAQREGLFTLVSIGLAVVLGWSLMVGPQFLRQDFRQDLPLADILKTFPMPGWQVALGEVLGPVVLLAAFQWLLLLFGSLFLLSAQSASPLLPVGVLGAAILLPVIDAVLLLIPNAAVLLFPSWVQAGRDGPRGIEATGQRLVFFFGQLLVLVITLIPAGLAGGGIFLLGSALLGPAGTIPVAALAAALVLGTEAAFGVVLVGKLFERFDLSAEANP
jgi:hypothetical protein